MYNSPVQSPSAPIIVRVVEENEIAGLGDVMVQAIGLTGAIAIGALAFGLLLASVIITYRKLRSLGAEEIPQTQPLGLTPTETELHLKSRI